MVETITLFCHKTKSPLKTIVRLCLLFGELATKSVPPVHDQVLGPIAWGEKVPLTEPAQCSGERERARANLLLGAALQLIKI